jgi:histidinol-phosphate aminotransferase
MANHVQLSNRYNWQKTSKLVAAVAKKNNVAAENIIMAAGSTEILDAVARFAAKQKGNLVIADPSFGYWADAAEKNGLSKIAVPLTASKHHDLPAMLQAINADTRLVYICNPNNPTGTICSNDALVSFIEVASKQAIVMVDEAYIDFTKEKSLNTLAVTNKNLLVVKTFSKIYGMAGARVGYAIGHSQTIDQLSSLQSWVNGAISVPSSAAAIASLNDEKFVQETYASNEKVREYTMAQLEKMSIRCIPSSTNFLYFTLANYQKDYFQQLKSHHIIGTRIYEEQGQWTRITVGTMQEMQAFIKAIQ